MGLSGDVWAFGRTRKPPRNAQRLLRGNGRSGALTFLALGSLSHHRMVLWNVGGHSHAHFFHLYTRTLVYPEKYTPERSPCIQALENCSCSDTLGIPRARGNAARRGSRRFIFPYHRAAAFRSGPPCL